ncbi:unnamed protein product, partial [Brassica napus]
LSSVHCCSTSPVFGTRKTSRSMMNSWEPLYSGIIVPHHTAGNYMKSKKANKKFDFKVFTETGPKTSLIMDGTQQNDSDLKNKGGKPTVRVSNVGHALYDFRE